MDIQRILILGGLAVTAYLMILAWNQDYKPGTRTPPVEITTQEYSQADAASPDNLLPGHSLPTDTEDSVPAVNDSVPSVVDSTADLLVPEKALDESTLISVRTDVFELKIDKKGGDIVSGALPKFPTTLETPDDPFVLLNPLNTYSAQSGLIGRNGTDTSKGRPLFRSNQDRYELKGAAQLIVDLTLPFENDVQITKRFIFTRNDYKITVQYIVDNRSTKDWQAQMYTQIRRDSQDPVMSDTNVMGLQPYTGGATFFPGAPYTKLEFDDIEESQYKENVEGGYIAMVQHYFVSAWVPSDQQTYTYQARKVPNKDIYLFSFTSQTWVVLAGQKEIKEASFYMGPKDQVKLKKVSPGLDLTVDYGFLWWLAQPLFYLLTFIHGWVNNWGIAIIFLTIIVKSLLYPLSAASFRSMAKMRKLQPEMARLKERYGDDKQQFSQAMMALYKKEGANPLGGCLPMLLQMPVFLALYWSLMESVELRQAPFFLWIHDLSAMDPYFVLPILMGISMFLTQMMQPEPPDPIQAKVFKMMPIMFTFFFLWFPSGLVLYWFSNNLLSILQQWYVNRQIEKST